MYNLGLDVTLLLAISQCTDKLFTIYTHILCQHNMWLVPITCQKYPSTSYEGRLTTRPHKQKI